MFPQTLKKKTEQQNVKKLKAHEITMCMNEIEYFNQ